MVIFRHNVVDTTLTIDEISPNWTEQITAKMHFNYTQEYKEMKNRRKICFQCMAYWLSTKALEMILFDNSTCGNSLLTTGINT